MTYVSTTVMTTHHNLDFAHNTDTNTSTSIKMMAPMIAITYTAHSGRGKSATKRMLVRQQFMTNSSCYLFWDSLGWLVKTVPMIKLYEAVAPSNDGEKSQAILGTVPLIS